MPLARITLSRSQRCASKRRTCGSPRLSKTGSGGWITFIAFPLGVARGKKAAGARSLRLAADGFEDRRPASELVLENARRFVGADVAHRLEAEPDELALEFAVGQRLLGDRVDALEDRRRRAGGSENAERGLRHHPRQPGFHRGWKVGRAPDSRLRIHREDANLAGAMEVQNLRGGVGREHRNLPADYVGNGLADALVRLLSSTHASTPLHKASVTT